MVTHEALVWPGAAAVVPLRQAEQNLEHPSRQMRPAMQGLPKGRCVGRLTSGLRQQLVVDCLQGLSLKQGVRAFSRYRNGCWEVVGRAAKSFTVAATTQCVGKTT
jgi:hypothetical protein